MNKHSEYYAKDEFEVDSKRLLDELRRSYREYKVKVSEYQKLKEFIENLPDSISGSMVKGAVLGLISRTLICEFFGRPDLKGIIWDDAQYRRIIRLCEGEEGLNVCDGRTKMVIKEVVTALNSLNAIFECIASDPDSFAIMKNRIDLAIKKAVDRVSQEFRPLNIIVPEWTKHDVLADKTSHMNRYKKPSISQHIEVYNESDIVTGNIVTGEEQIDNIMDDLTESLLSDGLPTPGSSNASGTLEKLESFKNVGGCQSERTEEIVIQLEDDDEYGEEPDSNQDLDLVMIDIRNKFMFIRGQIIALIKKLKGDASVNLMFLSNININDPKIKDVVKTIKTKDFPITAKDIKIILENKSYPASLIVDDETIIFVSDPAVQRFKLENLSNRLRTINSNKRKKSYSF